MTKQSLKKLSLFTIGLSICLISSFADAFVLIDAKEPRWLSKEVTVNYNLDMCTADYPLHVLLPDALKLWNSVPFTSLKLKMGKQTADYFSTITGEIIVFCSSTDPGTGILGRAAPSWNSSGEIYSGSVSILTGAQVPWADFTTRDKIGVLAHEIGHTLGFGHSLAQGALMGIGVYTINDDDKAAMQYLYPRNELQGGFYGCATVGPTRSRPEILAFLILPLLLLGALRSPRRVLSRLK